MHHTPKPFRVRILSGQLFCCTGSQLHSCRKMFLSNREFSAFGLSSEIPPASFLIWFPPDTIKQKTKHKIKTYNAKYPPNSNELASNIRRYPKGLFWLTAAVHQGVKNEQIRALRQQGSSQPLKTAAVSECQCLCFINGRLLKWKATVLTTAFTGYYKKVKQSCTSVAVLKIRVVTKSDENDMRKDRHYFNHTRSLLWNPKGW